MASTETLIAGNYRDGVEALHAADAALERAIADVAPLPDWSSRARLAGRRRVGGIRSTFGDAALSAEMLDGRTLDLVKATNLLNCPQVFPPASTPCSAAQMDHVAGDRPWGSNNPRWRLYARGWLSALAPASTRRSTSRRGWQTTPPKPTATRRGTGWTAANPGAGVLQLRSEAFGPGGAHRAVEATIARAGGGRARHLVAPGPVSTRVRHGDQRLDRQSPGGQGRRTVPRARVGRSGKVATSAVASCCFCGWLSPHGERSFCRRAVPGGRGAS